MLHGIEIAVLLDYHFLEEFRVFVEKAEEFPGGSFGYSVNLKNSIFTASGSGMSPVCISSDCS